PTEMGIGIRRARLRPSPGPLRLARSLAPRGKSGPLLRGALSSDVGHDASVEHDQPSQTAVRAGRGSLSTAPRTPGSDFRGLRPAPRPRPPNPAPPLPQPPTTTRRLPMTTCTRACLTPKSPRSHAGLYSPALLTECVRFAILGGGGGPKTPVVGRSKSLSNS